MKLFIEILPKLPIYLLLIFSSCGVIAGDYFAKLWSINTKTSFLFLAFLGYIISSFFYIPTLLKEGLIVTSIIWSLISIIGFLFIGFVVFKETLNTMQIIGVCVGLVALVILTIADYV